MKKNKIKVIALIVSSILFFTLLVYICLFISFQNIDLSKPELRSIIEAFTEEYNKSCNENMQVELKYYYEAGQTMHCDLFFSEDASFDDESIIDFFMVFHNNFGYDCFCNKEINSEMLKRYRYVYFQFDNIRMSYGNEKPLPMELSGKRDDIDATIHGIYKRIEMDLDKINGFTGSAYAF